MKYTLVALCALVLSACGASPAKAPADSGAEGSGTITAPSPNGVTTQGEAAEVASDLPPSISAVNGEGIAKILADNKGKVIVLNFWATWCPPCVEEMPDFVKFYNGMDREKVAFVSLSGDDVALIEKDIRKFQEKFKLPFPIHVLGEVEPDELYKALRTEISGALPTTLIYNREGVVVEHWEGMTTLEEIQAAVKPLSAS